MKRGRCEIREKRDCRKEKEGNGQSEIKNIRE
jgi:hypothetical protein